MRSRWPIRLQSILPAVLIAASCEAAHAAPLEGVIGLDVQAGPRNETTRTAFAGAGLGLSPRVAASLLLARSATTGIAATHAVVGGIALAMSPQARLRGWAVRSLSAPEGAAFTRWIVGPELGHADGVRLGLFYSDETNGAA